jgi:ADP-ribosyltransferase exoenzyme
MPGLLDALGGGLGYAGDVMEKFGGREVRGLLGGKPREPLSAIPFSDTLGITDPNERVRGADLARQWGLARPDDPFSQAATGFGIDVLTDPLMWATGGFAGHRIAKGLAGAEEAPSRFSQLKALREPTAMVKGLGRPEERVVGGLSGLPDEEIISRSHRAIEEASKGLPQNTAFLAGANPPWVKEGGIAFSASPEYAGHELMHGMVQNAAAQGGEEALPFLGRQAAREYRLGGYKTKGFEAGLGSILDELNSAGIDVRKTRGYARGALDQALSPEFHRVYHNQFANASPTAAALFHAAPGVLPGAALGAGAGGVAGYQQNGGEGALLGALAGGLGGAGLGGFLSHLRYAPNALTKGGEALGTTGAIRSGRAPFTPEQIRQAIGIDASQFGFEEASKHYAPLSKRFLPEEIAALKQWSSHLQERISNALRGSTTTIGGTEIDPFEQILGMTPQGTLPLDTRERVLSDVVPYLDSAISRSRTPKDALTYRLAGRLGELTPETAPKMVGQTVSDPSHLATTINPWGRFYGNEAEPRSLLLDMAMPKGSPGAYLEGTSNWDKEKELLLPRNQPFKVADVQKVPVADIDRLWYRLDPAGKPIPVAGQRENQLFSHFAGRAMEDIGQEGKIHGDWVVPDEFMKPDWRDFMASHTRGQGEQTNVLLQMLEGAQPHLPNVRRDSPEQMYSRIFDAINTTGEFSPSGYSSRAKTIEGMKKIQSRGGYPEWDLLDSLKRMHGVQSLEDIMASRPWTPTQEESRQLLSGLLSHSG